jgi:hypothetical protein
MLEEIMENYPYDEDDESTHILKADGFDEAVIGIASDFIEVPRLIYSVTKCLKILQERDGMDDSEAYEYFTYNVSGGYFKNMPIWCWDDFE